MKNGFAKIICSSLSISRVLNINLKSYAATFWKRERTLARRHQWATFWEKAHTNAQTAVDSGQSSGRGRTPTRRQQRTTFWEQQAAFNKFFFKIWEWAHTADSVLPTSSSDTMKTIIKEEENWRMILGMNAEAIDFIMKYLNNNKNSYTVYERE